MKKKFTKELVLVTPDLDKKMRMEADMSDYTIRRAEYKDGKWQLVAFLSKSLNKSERNYEIHDKEILAVIRGLENWRYLLEGVMNRP